MLRDCFLGGFAKINSHFAIFLKITWVLPIPFLWKVNSVGETPAVHTALHGLNLLVFI